MFRIKRDDIWIRLRCLPRDSMIVRHLPIQPTSTRNKTQSVAAHAVASRFRPTCTYRIKRAGAPVRLLRLCLSNRCLIAKRLRSPTAPHLLNLRTSTQNKTQSVGIPDIIRFQADVNATSYAFQINVTNKTIYAHEFQSSPSAH